MALRGSMPFLNQVRSLSTCREDSRHADGTDCAKDSDGMADVADGYFGPMLGQAHHQRGERSTCDGSLQYRGNRLYGVLDRRLRREYVADEYSIAGIHLPVDANFMSGRMSTSMIIRTSRAGDAQ